MAANDDAGTPGKPPTADTGLDEEQGERLAALFKPSWQTVAASKRESQNPAAPAKQRPGLDRVRQTTLVGLAPASGAKQAAASGPSAPPAQYGEYTPPMPVATKQSPQIDAPARSVEVREESADGLPERTSSESASTQVAHEPAPSSSTASEPAITERTAPPTPAVVQLSKRDLILIGVTVIALLPIFIAGLRALLAPTPIRVVYDTVVAPPQVTATASATQPQHAVPPTTAAREMEEAPTAHVEPSALPKADERIDLAETPQPEPTAVRTAKPAAPQPSAPPISSADSTRATKPATTKKSAEAVSSSTRSSSGAPRGPIVRESPF